MGQLRRSTSFLFCSYTLLWAVLRIEASPQQQLELFERNIRPIFATRCNPCHAPEQKMAGLDLMSAAGFRRGADSGALVDPSNVDNSRLLKAIS